MMNKLQQIWHRLDRPFIFPLCVALLSVLGAAVIWLNSPHGVVAGYDSFFYVSAAKNLVNGAGLGRLQPDGQLIPLTHYPPFYSWCLAALSLLAGGDVLDAARWLAGLTFGVNIFLFGWMTYRLLQSRWAGMAAALFVLVSPVLIAVNIEALTEGLYLDLMVAGLFVLAGALKNLGWRQMILAGILVALACLTRYVGSTLIVAGLVALFFLSRQPLRKRLAACAVFGLASGFPLAAWYLRNWLQTGSATNRIFELHLPLYKDYIRALTTIAGWFFKVETQEYLMKFDARIWWVAVLGVVVLVAALGWTRRAISPKAVSALGFPFVFSAVLLIYALVYAGSLWVSKGFFDASTRWDSRMLSPLYVVGALFVLLVVWYGFQLAASRWRKTFFALSCFLLCFIYIGDSNTVVDANRTNLGGGFTSLSWDNSETIQYLKSLPPGWSFYSNNTTVIYFQLWQPAYGIPEVYDGVKKINNPLYPQYLARMRQFLQQPHTALVIFDPYGSSEEYPPITDLISGLEVVRMMKDGTVYAAPHP
jgi:4-amino-4-deoxy-L-arabinose transferase-like glycosyltransferase